jgi:A/G-specific adenine glycosylase
MMDLGAILCVRSKLRCHDCPLQKNCIAHQQGIAHTLPRSKPARILPIRQVTVLVLLKNKNTVLLEKRPSQGIWGGLFSLPEATGSLTIDDLHQLCKRRFQQPVNKIQLGRIFRHTFSHFHLDIAPAFIFLKKAATPIKTIEANPQIWYNLQQPDAVGLPAPIKTLLESLTHDAVNILSQT